LRFLFAPRKLPGTAVRRIERAQAVYVNAISISEIAIKASKHKFDIDREKLEAGLIEAGLNPLSFVLPHALRVQDIAPAHPDPFDRALMLLVLSYGRRAAHRSLR
jgi:PIN domain nuclease of toxin-antitoxin system